MAKNWRLAVCTRWRTLASALLVCLSILCTGVVGYFVYTTVDEYPTRRLESRIHKVRVGMSVAELESTLGPPDSKTDRVDKESPDHGKVGPEKIVEYEYSAETRFGESQTQYRILVDENTGKVASIHLSMGDWSMFDLTVWEEWAFLIAQGLMALAVLIVMLFFGRWCQSVTDAADDK